MAKEFKTDETTDRHVTPEAAAAETSGTCCSGRCNCPEGQLPGEPRGKMECYDWLADIPGGMADFDIVEVVFKNTRKGYYRNSAGLDLAQGDIVAVEGTPGHDIGRITLTGRLVALQMKKARVKPGPDVKRVFRKAKPADIEKYQEAKARENETMIRARKIAEDLKLNMKIGDVEYQGDGNKAIFYYIADERVDFRQLIKVLADTFKVRIEMKQIGARQEAGRIGGIGPCGRPLCCSSWMSNFVSVGTAAARFQDISLNPQKLAGQCAKLKCCLNFEVDTYVESAKFLPPRDARLETADATYFHFKTDIFKKEITYSTDKSIAANLVTIDAERAFEVIAMNKAGEKPLKLEREGSSKPEPKKDFVDLVGQDSLTRFDRTKKKKKKKKSAAARQGADTNAPEQKAGEATQPRQRSEKPKDRKTRPEAESRQPRAAEGNADKPQNQRKRRRGGKERQQGGDKSANQPAGND